MYMAKKAGISYAFFLLDQLTKS